MGFVNMPVSKCIKQKLDAGHCREKAGLHQWLWPGHSAVKKPSVWLTTDTHPSSSFLLYWHWHQNWCQGNTFTVISESLVNVLNLMNWCLRHRCTVMNQCLVNILNLMNWCLTQQVTNWCSVNILNLMNWVWDTGCLIKVVFNEDFD